MFSVLFVIKFNLLTVQTFIWKVLSGRVADTRFCLPCSGTHHCHSTVSTSMWWNCSYDTVFCSVLLECFSLFGVLLIAHLQLRFWLLLFMQTRTLAASYAGYIIAACCLSAILLGTYDHVGHGKQPWHCIPNNVSKWWTFWNCFVSMVYQFVTGHIWHELHGCLCASPLCIFTFFRNSLCDTAAVLSCLRDYLPNSTSSLQLKGIEGP